VIQEALIAVVVRRQLHIAIEPTSNALLVTSIHVQATSADHVNPYVR
jgi:hypothetical protein